MMPMTSDNDSMVEMRAISDDVVIRDRPAFNGLNAGWVYEGNTINVDVSTRTEAEGHIWVKHIRGWSPERTVSGDDVFLIDAEKSAFFQPGETHPAPEPPDDARPEDTTETVPDAPPKEPEKVAVAKTTETPKVEVKPAVDDDAQAKVVVSAPKTAQLEARATVNIRSKPSANASLVDKKLVPGSMVDYDPENEVEADGYVWVEHEDGWSAVRTVDGSSVFLVEPGAPVNAGAPTPASLPGYRTLIERLPVSMDATVWFQYFGNNVFAYTDGADFNYDGYSQGLHGGLDFANKKGGIPIYAGVHCQYETLLRRSPNLQIWTRQGDYTFIYQHITNVRPFEQGQAITPDTVIAEIEPLPWFHLHFEIRYKDEWIINPLWLMPDALVHQITGKFDPQTPGRWPSDLKFFFKNKRWAKWITPLDQPAIKRRGSLIGPKAP
jgi:hypothetical protein